MERLPHTTIEPPRVAGLRAIAHVASCFAQRVKGAVQIGIEQFVIHLIAHVRERGGTRRETCVREYAINAAHDFECRVETALDLCLVGDVDDFSVSLLRASLPQLFQCLRVAVCSTSPHYDIGPLPRAAHEEAEADAAIGAGSEYHPSS
jgi:hypothetical protein